MTSSFPSDALDFSFFFLWRPLFPENQERAGAGSYPLTLVVSLPLETVLERTTK